MSYDELEHIEKTRQRVAAASEEAFQLAFDSMFDLTLQRALTKRAILENQQNAKPR